MKPTSILALALILLIAAGCQKNQCTPLSAEMDQTAAYWTGKPAPAFALDNVNGERVSLKDLFQSGSASTGGDGGQLQNATNPKPVVLMLGRMSCPYTLNEIKEINRMALSETKGDLTFLTVVEGTKSAVSQWAHSNDITLTLLVDATGEVLNLYSVKKSPDICLLDTEGMIVYRGGGGFIPAAQLKPLVERLAAGKEFYVPQLPRPGRS